MMNGIFSLLKRSRDFAALKICRLLKIPPSTLLFPVVWITNKCNLRCKFCDQWETPPELISQELTKNEWFQFVDTLKELHPLVVIITGGEPLLREDIFEIIRYVNKRGIYTHICSNGTLIDENIAKELRNSGLNSISVSLDSFDSKVHNTLRGIECFDEVVNGINFLKRYAPKIKVGINVVINRLNFRNLYKIFPLAERLEVDMVRFDGIHTNLAHRKKPLHTFDGLLFQKEDIPELLEELNKLIRTACKSKIGTNSKIYLKKLKDYFQGNLKSLKCYAGYISCAVDALGNVSVCDNFDGCESVKNKSISDIWYSVSFHKMRERVHTCNEKCWDTTHGELNIRCNFTYCLFNFRNIIKEFRFYA